MTSSNSTRVKARRAHPCFGAFLGAWASRPLRWQFRVLPKAGGTPNATKLSSSFDPNPNRNRNRNPFSTSRLRLRLRLGLRLRWQQPLNLAALGGTPALPSRTRKVNETGMRPSFCALDQQFSIGQPLSGSKTGSGSKSTKKAEIRPRYR